MARYEELPPAEFIRPFWRRRKTWVVIGACLALALVVNWCGRRSPLPTDEEMIAHFQAHRAEFEELVHRYRTFAERERWPELKWPSEEQDTVQLGRKIGVPPVNYLSLGYWLPDTYSLATAQRVQAMRDSCAQDVKQWRSGGNSCLGVGREAKTQDEKRRLAMDCEKAHMPAPKCRLLGYQYGVLQFQKKLSNTTYHAGSWRYVAVWKDYLHFPEPPRIEEGYLLGPMETDGTYSYKKRAFSSLNYYPFNWKEYECVYRPIDAHWFITLCNGH